MADAGAGGDAGNRGILNAGIDQTGAATGDQQVDIAIGGHQLSGGGTGGVLHQIDGIFRDADLFEACLQGGHNGISGTESFLAATQDTDIAALQRQRGRVGGDVGTAFVNNGDNAHGNRNLPDVQSIRTGMFLQ